MNINSTRVLLSFFQKVSELNPQVGTEVETVSNSIRTRVNRVRQKLDRPSTFNQAPGSSGPVRDFSNIQTPSSPNINMGGMSPGNQRGNPQVQEFQGNFAPLGRAAVPPGVQKNYFGQR